MNQTLKTKKTQLSFEIEELENNSKTLTSELEALKSEFLKA